MTTTSTGTATGAPMVVDMADAALWQDPYPTWRAAREQHRTARTATGEPILLAADDLDVAVSDPAFAVLGLDALHRLGIHDGPFHEWRRLTLAAVDGAHHERLRAVVGRAFTPRRVEPLRASLQAHIAAVLDVAVARGRFDVVADYATPLPLWVICRFLGLPGELDAEIAAFLVGTEEGFAEPMTPEHRRRAEDSIVALSEVVQRLVDDRRAHPRADLVTDLVEAEAAGRLDAPELAALVVNIIGGAIGSTRSAIANGALLLLQHRDQARLVADDPARLRPAVEECLRFHPPFRAGRRKVVAAVERFGLALEPGDTVYLARQAANRDPARWADPDRFDVARPERRHHSFGYGPHFCLGQALAQLDVQEALRALVERIDDLDLVDDVPQRVPFTADEALVRLDVTVRPPGPATPPGGTRPSA